MEILFLNADSRNFDLKSFLTYIIYIKQDQCIGGRGLESYDSFERFLSDGVDNKRSTNFLRPRELTQWRNTFSIDYFVHIDFPVAKLLQGLCEL